MGSKLEKIEWKAKKMMIMTRKEAEPNRAEQNGAKEVLEQ